MKKRKKYLLVPLIIICLLIIIYFLSGFLANYRLGLTKVLISKVSIPERNKITNEYFDYIYLPKAYISNDVFLNEDELLSKYVKQNAYVPKGSLFYKDLLDDEKDMNDLLHLDLDKDEVTYDLFVKDIKVNPAHLLKDMKVDLYLTVNRKDVVSDLLISNARITGLYDVNDIEIKNSNSQTKLGTISLAVKKEMVPYLNKAITIGNVNLVVAYDPYGKKEMFLNRDSSIFELIK